ncbi:MAG: D-glycero-alpha-D-manno-heptose 1-phosphate guanylyltransferase [Alphaproteobacteria bacterium MarineAlpha9_Bin1]|nr:MAG: D-glycero-alpha-D-manno-heptose 1-phosphate guanylyltransferase [Alphaproteobacteria bacterium MarineAlpha9_Bin1]
MKMKNNSKFKISQALILAAGYGKRMQPLTLKTPKPLIKLLNKPLISYILDQLIINKINNCFINSHYLYRDINKYIKKFQKQNSSPKIFISYEKDVLDTGGAIKNLDNVIMDEPLIVLNGDSIIFKTTSLNPLDELIFNFKAKKMDALLLLDDYKNAIGYEGKGDFIFENRNLPSTIYREPNIMKNSYAFTGWQILNPKLLNNINKDKFSLNHFYDKAIDNKRLWAIKNKNKWIHIGTIQALKQSEEWLKRIRK